MIFIKIFVIHWQKIHLVFSVQINLKYLSFSTVQSKAEGVNGLNQILLENISTKIVTT